MKMKNTLSAIVVAMAAFAAPFAAKASTGDIVDIRVVDTDEFTFGDRNVLSPNRCTADHPLVAGDELLIRVRMLVRNYAMAAHNAEAPLEWKPPVGITPKLGLVIGTNKDGGPRAAYAEYRYAGYAGLTHSGTLDTDNAGNIDSTWTFPPWQYYTDFYFVYRVQPGDLGLPVRLMNASGGIASETDTNTGYYLSCTLQNDLGDIANFWYGPELLPPGVEWPDGIPGDTQLRNYDLAAEGAYLKTIDFDKEDVEAGVWRNVYLGMTAASAKDPELVVGGGALADATTVYIWSGDEGVVVPAASGANTLVDVDGKKVLKVIVPVGSEGAKFALHGVDAAAVGATATIYLSPSQSAVYRPTGELADVTVSRTVKVVRAPIDFDEVNGEGQPYVPGEVWRYVYPGSSEAPNTTPEIKIRENASAEATTVYIWSADETVMVPVATGANTIDTSTGKTVLKVPVAAGSTSAAFAMKGAAGAAVGATTTVYVSPMLSAVGKSEAELEVIADPRKIEVVAAPAPKISIALKSGGVTKEEQTVIADADYASTKVTLVFSTPTPCTADITLGLSASIVGGGGSLSGLYSDNILRICDSGSSAVLDGTPVTVTFPAGKYTVEKDIHILGASASTENGIKFAHSSSEVATAGTCTLYVLRGGDEHPIAVTSFSPDNSQPLECDPSVAKTFNLKLDDTYRSLNDTANGYTLYLRNSDTWDVLQTKANVKANPARKLVQWPIAFDKSYDGMSVDIYALSPDGLTQTVPVTYTIKVKDSKQVLVSPAEAGVYTIGEGHPYAMALALNQPFSGTLAKYIFLKGATDADKALFTSAQTTTGASVGPNAPYTASASATFLDGRVGGTPVTINAFLADSQDDPTNVTGGWSEGSITVNVTNEPPHNVKVKVGGLPVREGETFSRAIPCEVPKEFALTVEDVDADLNATGDDAFTVNWSIGSRSYPKRGNPNGQTVTNTFHSVGTEEVYIELQDKDGGVAEFRFFVRVVEQPHVSIESDGSFQETESMNSMINVRLSQAATADVVVRFSVPQVTSGFLAIDTTDSTVSKALDDEGKVIPGAYDLSFASGETLKTLIVSDMDGTRYTGNLRLSAKVITETVNADGVKWCDFYKPDELSRITVKNDDPIAYAPPENSDSYTNTVSVDVLYSFEYACTDVPADMTNMWLKSGVETNYGIRVTISVDGGIPVVTTNITDETYYTFTGSFSQPGYHFVTVKFEDKDGGSVERLLRYDVPASRLLEISTHGPAGAVGSNTGDSMRYGFAAGLGAGRVYAGDGPRAVKEFVHTYAVDKNETAISVRAYGYGADSGDDDGTLGIMDVAIDEDGNRYISTSGKAYYNYSTHNLWGRRGFDSFVYAFACNNVEASTSGGSSTSSKQLLITIGKTGSAPIPLPADESKKESAAVLTYPKQYWEAVFSREFLKSDNCGDINADGIPDAAVYRYGMGIFDSAGAIVDTAGESDLTDLSTYNKDLDKDGVESPDFLPSAGLSTYGSLIPGLAGTWEAEFTAKLEIRGYHDGLNDAMSQLGFDVVSDIVYAVPEETTDPDTGDVTVMWRWDEDKCTISELEYLAWTEYAAAHDWSPGAWTNDDGSVRWSPERPTNPTLDDTDGDGFSDGYEYYFWYRAHVGYFEYDSKGNRVHRRMTGRRYDPRNPGDGVLITSEEIARIMDPRVAYDPATAATRDTDNDGLPDLLEFEIGTNPFDFDTDGDGLPDGWELMIAGLNPLLAQSSSEAVLDAERNYDGDAMAITSFELEKVMDAPKQLHPENVQYTTLAVIDPNGDSDGVQWYASTGTVAVATNTVQMHAFKLADGTDVVSSVEPKVTSDGRLANTLARGEAYLSSISTYKEVDDSVDPPVTNTVTVVTRGWPVYIAAGTPVDASSVNGAQVDVDVLSVANAVKAENINAAWVYGKGTADNARGSVAKTAAEYGCLALGRQLALAKGTEFCALPSKERDVALLHYLVYQQFGFDPRTAWSTENPLAARWGKTANGDAVEGVLVTGAGAYCSVPARTRAYTAYDEFLVYSFFLNNGCDMGGYSTTIADSAPYLAKVWSVLTTNPQGPNEPGNITLNITTTDGSDAAKEYYFGRDSENGADTDGDGVPDGWELYVMAGPKKDGAFVFANPYAGFATALSGKVEMPTSAFSPFVPSAQKNDTNNQIYLGGAGNDDGLNEYQEFESTDAMNYYAKVYEGAETTVVHTDDWKWLNKFFPTNPWSKDTDGDGLSDSAEKAQFAYGTPADDGKLRSIPGGGLNPNSVDTDCDGLPDPWEVQFKGKTPFPGDLPAALAALGDKAKDADGNEIGNYLQGLVDGMDGTVKDAFSYPIRAAGGTNGVQVVTADGFRQCVNRDYDHDGLENWQEYQTGMMRCWRYDDPISPFRPIPRHAYYKGTAFDPDPVLLEELTGDSFSSIDEFWYKTLVDKMSPLYNPRMVMDMSSGAQYLSRVTNAWDSCYKDLNSAGSGGAYYWFYNRVGDTKIDDLWSEKWTPLDRKAPIKYACCSPIDPDSDHDGMDDYYELFHGMNPLLGVSEVNLASQGPCDLVFDSWAGNDSIAWPAWTTNFQKMNYWQVFPWKKLRGNTYDFEVFPWLTGIVDADPDGDGIPNQTEALFPKLSAPELHSDPTPLWMTDSSCSNSLVRRFYRLPTRYDDVYIIGDTFTYNGKTYEFRDFEGYVPPTEFIPAHFTKFEPDSWKLATSETANWMFSFEENEGYDSDHDGLSDLAEKEGKYRKATDVQDADSPRRRQAMYFQGPDRPSALQTMPQIVEAYPVQATSYPDDMALRTFTVECWVRPESLDDSVIIERAVFIGVENPADEEYMRKNFQLGIRDGRWYVKFDPFTTRFDDAVTAISKSDADATKWTHLAATYDGSDLILYVNGVAERVVRSGLLPAYGSSAVTVQPAAAGATAQEYWSDLEYTLHAFIVGASAKTMADDPSFGGEALDLTKGVGWDGYTRFYKGWIDEIRVWDGARTAAEVAGSMKTRFTAAMADENRTKFYELWSLGWRRDAKDENGKPYELPAELLHHWTFDSVFGAENELAVATSPHGFNDERAVMSRAVDYVVPWWRDILDSYDGAVYDDRAWVPWIPDTVAHLPRFDGTTLDSFFWSEDFMGDAAGTYKFARSAEPVSLWTQMSRAATTASSEYGHTGTRYTLVNTVSGLDGSNQNLLFEFTGRHLNQSGDDLLPLGGAYAKFCDNEVGLWDGQGASSNWEVSGSDADGDGLPDWWEQYADENYRRSGMDPSEEIGWETIVSYNGVEMTAGEAYLRDLARGSYMNEFGETVIGSGSYEQRADEDGSGIPDWWEEVYGITGESGLDDHDNDGLPNYVEYLLSEVFKFEGVTFSPINPRSADRYTLDYFYRVGSLYVGEIFTDHDQVDDDWEALYPTLDDGATPYASRFAYDAAADVDEDGWSNRSEARYSKQVMPTVANVQNHYTSADGLVADYPIPTLALTLRYNGFHETEMRTAPIVVQVARSSRRGTSPDAEYRIGAIAEDSGSTGQSSTKTERSSTSYTRTLGKWADRHVFGTLTPGNVQLNSLSFEFCSDPSSMVYSWELIIAGVSRWKRGTRTEYDSDRRRYGEDFVVLVSMTDSYAELEGLELRTDETGAIATWIHNASGNVLGTINLTSGAFDIDFGVLKGRYATGSSNSTDRVSLEDQTYRITYATRPAVGLPRKLYLGAADTGHVREGENDIVVFSDLNGNGKFDPGDEPYGVYKNLAVSWKGVSAEIELTDESPVTPRFDLFAAGTMQVATTNIVEGEVEITEPTRVRVVRWKIDDKPIYNMAVTNRVVFDKVMDPSTAAAITENDFVVGDTFDLDWDNFFTEVVNARGVIAGNYKIVKADYLAIFGDGDVSWLSDRDTNKWATASKKVITRYYGANRVTPVPVSPGSVSPSTSAMGIVNTANPTFGWTLDCPEREAYTAFRIVVTNGTGTVYDSGVRRAPARDGDGVYRWAAPLYVDDKTTLGKVFANKAVYGWRVAMYNSKFRDDAYSDAASFYLEVQTNGYSTGTANVGVRYFGPEKSYEGKVIRVQAFSSPDFSGIPVAAGYVKDVSALARTGEEVAANCQVVGLPDGQFYLRAFIDSNNNGVCDDWESSGYLCARDGTSADWLNPTPVTVGPAAGFAETAEIYLEDADTDNDGLPDAWEYATYGSLTAKGIELLSETPAGEELVNASLVGALKLRETAQVPAAGLATRVRSALGNAGTLALALGVNPTGYDSFAAAISGSVSEKLAEDGVKITSLSFADGKVLVTVDIETEAGSELTGPLASSVTPKSSGLEVVAKVYWKQSLADSQWTLVGEKTFAVGSGETEIDAGDAVSGTSGFYKVEVEEKK